MISNAFEDITVNFGKLQERSEQMINILLKNSPKNFHLHELSCSPMRKLRKLYFGNNSYIIKSKNQRRINKLEVCSFSIIPDIKAKYDYYHKLCNIAVQTVTPKMSIRYSKSVNCIVVMQYTPGCVLAQHTDYDKTMLPQGIVHALNIDNDRIITFFGEIDIIIKKNTITSIINAASQEHKVCNASETVCSTMIMGRTCKYESRAQLQGWEYEEHCRDNQYNILMNLISLLKIQSDDAFGDNTNDTNKQYSMETCDRILRLSRKKKKNTLKNSENRKKSFKINGNKALKIIKNKHKKNKNKLNNKKQKNKK